MEREGKLTVLSQRSSQNKKVKVVGLTRVN